MLFLLSAIIQKINSRPVDHYSEPILSIELISLLIDFEYLYQ